ncbi:hypothetical protein [Alkalicoccus saliphilus]|uniref:Uncharacterized protein n=1 Tax=Alkalicoccus saliphilus TaxID=200989 RepID=A0A2T4U1T9_9BACI|nr:hypothetical protein [Alkalicoccus saliphilus]PTL37369.1 hypothetical protein C6Y45_16845 [Alkalicoccus saliphilus]
MKKMIIIGGAIVVTSGAVLFGQLFWNDEVERTTEEAMERIETDHDGNRNPGSSIIRFLEEKAEDLPGAAAEAAAAEKDDSNTGASIDNDDHGSYKGNIIEDDTTKGGSEKKEGSSAEKGDTSSASGSGSFSTGMEKGAGAGQIGGSSSEKKENRSDNRAAPSSDRGDNAASRASENRGGASERASERGKSQSGSAPGQSGNRGAGLKLEAQEILDTYLEQFEELQSQEIEIVEQVVSDARSDYKKYEAGEMNESGNEIQARYVERVQRLENQADDRFDDIYEELQTALEEHGHDPDKAVEFKLIYNAEKETRRLEAINQIFDH